MKSKSLPFALAAWLATTPAFAADDDIFGKGVKLLEGVQKGISSWGVYIVILAVLGYALYQIWNNEWQFKRLAIIVFCGAMLVLAAKVPEWIDATLGRH